MNEDIISQAFSWGPPLLKFQLSEDELNSVIQTSEKANADYSHNLAGQVNQQLTFSRGDAEQIYAHVKKYFNAFSKYCFGQERELNLIDMWINHMKDGDYNPLHIHGAHISFVLYTYVSDELKLEQSQSRSEGTSRPGDISFVYGQPLENTPIPPITMHDISPNAGDLFIFPTYLGHIVYPFRSKGFHRSSISGNFAYE